MNLTSRYNLWRAKKELSPDKKFKVALERKLNAAWEEKYVTKFAWYQTAWIKRTAAFTSVVIIGSSLVTGAYAYTSPDVTIGTPLYQVKQQIEKVEEKVQVTPEAKAKFLLKQVERREAEAVVMKKRGQKLDNLSTQIEKTEEKLQKAEQNLEKINSKDTKLRMQIRERLQNKLDNLNKKHDRLEGRTGRK